MATVREISTAPRAAERGLPPSEPAALAAGGIAAFLAGACCVVPLLVASLGLSGAWLASLLAFEPYRPAFIGVALAALGYAGWRIFRPAPRCEGVTCAAPRTSASYKIGFFIVTIAALVMMSFPWFAPYLL